MHELGAISDLAGRAGSYAMLCFSLDTADPERGALIQRARELGAEIETRPAVLRARVERAAGRARRRAAGRRRPRLLPPLPAHPAPLPPAPALRARGARAHRAGVTGSSAFRRLFTEQTSALEVDAARRRRAGVARGGAEPPPGPRPRRARGGGAARSPRRCARACARAPTCSTRCSQDKAIKDRLRYYPHWLASRNLANEASDESVEALIEAVRSRYELARRWYRLKARLLGLDRLAYWDRMAPVGDSGRAHPLRRGALDRARLLLASSPPSSARRRASSSPTGTSTARRGPASAAAPSAPTRCPSAHPYVMLNYTSRPHDVLTMAHELGPRRARRARPAAGHLPVHHPAHARRDRVDLRRDDRARAAARARPRRRRRGCPAGRLARRRRGRRVPPGRDEPLRARRAHRAPRARRAATDRFGELWLETQTDLLGDSVELHDDYGLWWSYVPHFVDTPGYVYAYAYGHLLALSVYRRYEEDGEDFVPSYLDLLRAGGSLPPEELGAIVGVDLSDPGFWVLGPRPDRAPARGGRGRRRGGRQHLRDRRRSRSAWRSRSARSS